MNKKELIAFENDVRELFLDKRIRFPCHLSGGNEDALLGLFEEVKPEDWVFSTHRNHYHALLHGFGPDKLKEWLCTYGSMHVYGDGFFTSGIVGGILPIALGVALGIKRNRGKNHVWCFIGDMAGYTGMFSECLTYAEGHKLPITFVVEDNSFSVNTPTKEAWGTGHGFDKRYYKYRRKYPHQGSGDWVVF